jgi:hypothetical protein
LSSPFLIKSGKIKTYFNLIKIFLFHLGRYWRDSAEITITMKNNPSDIFLETCLHHLKIHPIARKFFSTNPENRNGDSARKSFSQPEII